jgi:hypothetical protein
MSRVTPSLRDLAQRLIAAEARIVNPSGETQSPAAFAVCKRLRPHLAPLMGSTGFSAVLGRALALARAKVDWLNAVALTGDTLGVSEKVGEKVGPDVMAEGSLALLSELLALLVAFIGERLTLQMMREVWPNLSLNDLDSGDQP